MSLNEEFKKKGYIKINNFISDLEFENLSKKIKEKTIETIKKKNIKKLGGFIIGNLNINLGSFAKTLWYLLLKNDLDRIIQECFKKNISDFIVRTGGNLCLPKKGLQQFHTDGHFKDKVYILSIATEDINISNGPTEIVEDYHDINLPYWKFILAKKRKKKIFMKTGDIILRKHSLWHRGTVNQTSNPRLLISFLFFEKDRNLKSNLDENSGIKIYENFFESNIKGKIKEFIYVKLGFLFAAYKILKSL